VLNQGAPSGWHFLFLDLPRNRYDLGNAPQAAYLVPGGVAPVMLFEDVTSVSVTLTPKDYPGGDRVFHEVFFMFFPGKI
jgi:hypothetical protein